MRDPAKAPRSEERCLDCSRQGQRLRDVQEGRWECSVPECSHRVSRPELLDQSGYVWGGCYRTKPTSQE